MVIRNVVVALPCVQMHARICMIDVDVETAEQQPAGVVAAAEWSTIYSRYTVNITYNRKLISGFLGTV